MDYLHPGLWLKSWLHHVYGICDLTMYYYVIIQIIQKTLNMILRVHSSLVTSSYLAGTELSAQRSETCTFVFFVWISSRLFWRAHGALLPPLRRNPLGCGSRSEKQTEQLDGLRLFPFRTNKTKMNNEHRLL